MLNPDPYGGVPLGAEAIPGPHALPEESSFERQTGMREKGKDDDRTATRQVSAGAPPPG